MYRRTVDCDGNGLVEGVAISTYEGRDLAELVDIEVLGIDALNRVGVNDLKVDVVGLGNCFDGS